MNVRICVDSDILGRSEIESEQLLTTYDGDFNRALLSALLDDAIGKVRRAYKIGEGE